MRKKINGLTRSGEKMNKEREHERDCMNPRDKNKEEKISGDKRDRDKSEETRR